MKTLFSVMREPIMIGAFVLAILIVIASYVGSHYYYGETTIIETPVITPSISQPSTYTPPQLDLGELHETDMADTEAHQDAAQVEELSVEDFLAALSDEEKAQLTANVADELPRESPHGFGPYPNIPPDYPRQNLWDELERLDEVAGRELGRSSIDHELMHRVLIKLWNQGKKAEGALLDSDNGRVYPMYKDTVYVRWKEDVDESGNYDRYLGGYTCHPSLRDYRDSVEAGTQPSWMKVVQYADGGISPYSFLDLP